MRIRKLLSLLLCLTLVLSLFPSTAFAYTPDEGLYFRLLQQDSNGNYYVDIDPGNGLCGGDQHRPKESTYVQMCYIDALGNEYALSLNDPNLVFPSFLSTSMLQNDPTLIRVDYVQEGGGDVLYTAPNGNTFTLNWICSLNRVDCYSTPAVTIPGLILSDFDYKPGNDTFYIAAKGDWIITDIYRNTDTPDNQLQDIASITLDPSGKFATVRITGNLEGRNWYYTILCDTKNTVDGTTYQGEWVNLGINDKSPSLKFQWLQRDQNDNWAEEPGDLATSSNWTPSPGYSANLRFYFTEGSSRIPLDISQLTIDNGAFSMSQLDGANNSSFVHVTADGFGTGTISYTHTDGKTYTITFESVLPEVGFYTTPTASKNSYLREFAVTDTNNTFYLIARDNWVFSYATLSPEFDAFADLTMSADNKVAAITVTGSFHDDSWYDVSIRAVDPVHGGNTGNRNIGLRLTNGRPSLKFQWLQRDQNDNWVEESGSLRSSWSASRGNSARVRFYFVENGVQTPVELSRLTSNSPVFALSQLENTSDPTCVRLSANDFGTGTISYTHTDGKTYSISFDSTLPLVAFYSSPTPGTGSYINKFTVTASANTFYLIARDNWVFSYATLSPEFDDFADLTMSADNKVAAITVTGSFHDDSWYDVNFRATDPVRGGDTGNNNMGLRLTDGRPSLKFRWAEHDSNDNWHEDLTNSLQTYWSASPGDSSVLTFYYVENGVETKLTLSDIGFSNNLTVFHANNGIDDGLIRVNALNFGTGSLSYTHTNALTYTIPVTVDLPSFGCYSTPTPSQSSFIREFSLTDTQNTFYVAVPAGMRITALSLNRDLANIATYALSTDGSYAAITLTGAPDGRWYDVRADIYDGNRTRSYDCSLKLFDTRPALKFRWAERDSNDIWYEDSTASLQARWTTAPESNSIFTFYYVENGRETKLKLSDLSFSANLAASFANKNTDDGLVRVDALDFGSGTISYKGNANALPVQVSVGLPTLGCYSTPTPSQSSFIREFTLTDTQNTFYVAVPAGMKITSLSLNRDLANIAAYTLSTDGSYAAITLTGTPDGRWYDVQADIYDGNRTRSYDCSLKLLDGRPALKFRWAEHDSNDIWYEVPTDALQNRWITAPGFNSTFTFYYVENGRETKLKLSDLSFSANLAASFANKNTDDGLVRVDVLDFGSGTISYKGNANALPVQVSVDLPTLGCYSTPTPGQSSFIREFTLTDTQNTFYVAVPAGMRITALSLNHDLANISTYTLSTDGSYAAITLTGTPDGRWYDVQADIYDGNRTRSYGCSLKLFDTRPALKFRWARWDDANQMYFEDKGHQLESVWLTAPGSGLTASFYYVENGLETKLTFRDLTFSAGIGAGYANEGINDGIIDLNTDDFGSETISYTHTNNKTYIIPVTVDLPEVGYYTTPVPSQSSFIREFTVTDTDKTFYFAPLPGLTLDSIALDPEFESFADYVISQDRTYATVTVTDIFADMWYGIDAVINYGSGTWYNGNGLKLINDQTNLYFKEIRVNNGTGAEGDELLWFTWLYPTDVTHLNLYFGKPSALNKLSLSSLSVTGPIALAQNPDGSLRLEATDWGVGRISYSDGSKTYTIEVIMELPGWGALYKIPVRNTNNFLNDSFTATKSKRSVYIMPGDGFLFDYLELSPELDAIADYVIAPDRTYAELTITDDNFVSGEYVIEDMGRTIPGQTDHFWGNHLWSITLTNHIPDMHATFDPQPSAPSPSPSPSTATPLQLTMSNSNAQDITVSFQVALYDIFGRMIDLKTVDALIKAGETYVSPAVMLELANAASLKVIAIDDDFAPLIHAWSQAFKR